LLDRPFTEDEVKRAIFAQNNSKSPGPDTINAKMLKNTFNILSQFLLCLFNKLLSKGEYPSTWGHGIIVPIFKSGDPTEAKHYRGITLTNIIAKIYLTLLSNRLSHWAK